MKEALVTSPGGEGSRSFHRVLTNEWRPPSGPGEGGFPSRESRVREALREETVVTLFRELEAVCICWSLG